MKIPVFWFFCEICEFFKNTFFHIILPLAASQGCFFWHEAMFDWHLIKRGTTWNNPKRPTTSNKRPETTYNDLKRLTTNKKQPETTYNDKKRSETTHNELDTTDNDLNLRLTSKKKKKKDALFYNMGQSVLFSKTFSTQRLIVIIRGLLHGESWWI